MNRNELLTGDQNILSRTKYFCPGQNFFVPDKTFFVHAEGRGISFLHQNALLDRDRMRIEKSRYDPVHFGAVVSNGR